MNSMGEGMTEGCIYEIIGIADGKMVNEEVKIVYNPEFGKKDLRIHKRLAYLVSPSVHRFEYLQSIVQSNMRKVW